MTTKSATSPMGRRALLVLLFAAGLALMFCMNTLLVTRTDQHNNDYSYAFGQQAG